MSDRLSNPDTLAATSAKVGSAPYRPVHLASLTPRLETGAEGTIHLSSTEPLGPYERRATDRLVCWATHAPGRDFLA